MTCNDTGYQAIEFDAETHIPKAILIANQNSRHVYKCFEVESIFNLKLEVISMF